MLLDAPNGRVLVMFVASLQSAASKAFFADAMPIVQSFKFETGSN